MPIRSRRTLSFAAALVASMLLLATATVPSISSGADLLDAPALSTSNRLDADSNHLYVFTVAHPNATVNQVAPAIPREPPRADRISFGALDGLGEATVTGAPGAVLPLANVLLINVNTSHQAFVRSEADGSFEAKLFAPPGSFITVKHGPDHKFWQGTDQGAIQFGLTIFPSTTIHRPHTHSGDSNTLPFAGAGAIDIDTGVPTSIGAAWSLSGTVGPVEDLRAGDQVRVEATVRLYSQAISGSTDVSAISLQLGDVRPWLMLFDNGGEPLPAVNQAGSARLTPGGLPILDRRRPEMLTALDSQAVDWQFMGGNIIEGHLTLDMFLDSNMPPGVYRPVLGLEFTGVPAGSGWRAAGVGTIPSFTFRTSEVALPPLEVRAQAAAAGSGPNAAESARLVWYLLMDHASLGTRGTGAREDRALFQPSSFVVTQGAPYVVSPTVFDGTAATYRLEPYLPSIAYGRGATPDQPLLPFKLPGGQLCVSVEEPDGKEHDLGCETFAQSVSGDESTLLGELLNFGTIEVSEYYGLTTASHLGVHNPRQPGNSEGGRCRAPDGGPPGLNGAAPFRRGCFEVSLVKPGHHIISMDGWVEDVWGNRYDGGGTYDVWLAHPIDIDPGLLPGTPLAVDDAVNPVVQLQPRLPADVTLTVTHFPESDPARKQTYVAAGRANRFGHFAPDGPPIRLGEPGEYRLDLTAEYLDPASGELYMGAATWGGVVMTPADNATLVAHGRRGIDNLTTSLTDQWFVLCEIDPLPPLGSLGHIFNPYLNGDVIWSREDFDDPSECRGDALILGGSVQDTVGAVETAVEGRFSPPDYPLHSPGTFDQRVQADELPLFSSTTSRRAVSLVPQETDQIAYAYLSSQRPGVRVRESVAEDGQSSGYWRFDSMYDNQFGVGLEGDLPNDFKYQFVGIVYRDLARGFSEYLGHGSGWFHLLDNDVTGSRVMPPFSGPGNGGWPTTGGPLLHLKGEYVHMFILPTGVRAGTVMQLGDRFDFAGHVMPTLDSRVEVEVTAPSGQTRLVSGRANQVGYFYDPHDSFVLDEPGRWTANVRVWHDGQIGSGDQVNCDPAAPFDSLRPCPSGDVLGSANGQYTFYVVRAESPRLTLSTPAPGRLDFEQGVVSINISGPVPAGVVDAAVDYTISMPGFILEQGEADIANGSFSLTFDPVALHADFPNLDLIGRHGPEPGLADTFSIGLLLTGQQEGKEVYRATTLTIQGDQLHVESAADAP